MLLGRMGLRALLSLGVGVGIGVGGLGILNSQAAGWAAPVTVAADDAVVLAQAAPQASPCGPAPAAPCKEPEAKPKTKAKVEKKRRLTPCGPGLAPCGDTKL